MRLHEWWWLVRALGEPCKPTLKKRNRTWNLLDKGRHPKDPDVTVDVGPWGREAV